MRKITAIFAAMLMVLMGIMIFTPPAAAHTAEDPYKTDLIADGGSEETAIDVGDLLIWNDDTKLYVKYMIIAEDWCLTETHLHIESGENAMLEIPQTKKHNPIPGQFDYSNEHDCITEYTYEINLVEAGIAMDATTVIAAHSVVMDISCYDTAVVYGIERYTGTVYGIDVLSGTSWIEFDTEDPPVAGSATPNGHAYDAVNERFYYCDYYSPNTLYFWDTAQHEAGTLIGNVADADFYNGKYYYISGPPASDDLYEVAFNTDGTIATGYPLKIADIANNEHGWTFNGDIAIKDGVIYGWGLCNLHGYEFFTYDLTTSVFNVNSVSYTTSLQLAFGSDGTLYGHRSGGAGAFYEVDTTNGVVTLITPTPSPANLYTDCASGEICEPTTETAWADGTEFAGKNWATCITYKVQGPIYEQWPEGGTLSVAYEDLLLTQSNDYDYNDFVADIDVEAKYWGNEDERDLVQMEFTVTPEAKMAGYTHVMHLALVAGTFGQDGYYELYRDGSLVESGDYIDANGIDVIMVPYTGNYPDEAILTIYFDGESDWIFPAWDQSTYHGESLFYDPWIHVNNNGENIHTDDPRMLTVPVDWVWPTPDGKHIWDVYSKVTAGNPPTFQPYWWTP